MKLAGKVAIVTGAAQGIGKAIALKLAGEGATVVVNDVNIEKAKAVANEIQSKGGKATAFKADVTNRAEIQELMRSTAESLKAIDILVNNAGISRMVPIIEMTEEDWDIVLNVDLKGVFNCIQAVTGYMMKQRSGKIINISSVVGMGHVNIGRANYSAAKGGVVQLTKVAAFELGPYGVNVNAIAPGVIVTDLAYSHGTREEAEARLEQRKKVAVLGRVGEPEDIANCALFLASADSSFITGQVICVDGGRIDGM